VGMRAARMCSKCYATALPGQSQCERHAATPSPVRRRNELRPLYKCKRWRITRLQVLARDPICKWVENNTQCTRLATDVDHVVDAVEWVAQGHDFYDQDNLRGLCHGHHSQRTARDQGFAVRAMRFVRSLRVELFLSH
jgi:5-methylcytosine-specific restriction endonuclease McrA